VPQRERGIILPKSWLEMEKLKEKLRAVQREKDAFQEKVHARTHARTHAHVHVRAHTRVRTHTAQQEALRGNGRRPSSARLPATASGSSTPTHVTHAACRTQTRTGPRMSR
jgi:hypothetical protein